MANELHIFRAGTQTASSGVTLTISAADLAASAAAYDPAKHEAPIVIGHPRNDDPAYGWVQAMSAREDGLYATPAQVDAEFAELVEAGRYKKISASFYLPDSPSNPVPGVYYLRHVGFLGAQAPAIKGLRQASFSDAEQGTIEFSDWDDVQNASLWRSLRDWIIGKFGLAEADEAIPKYSVGVLEDFARTPDPEPAPTAPTFSESPQEGTVTPEQLAAENAALKKRLDEMAQQQQQAAAAARHTANVAFAEGLVQAGTLLPAHAGTVVAVLDFAEDAPQTVEFGEGPDRKPLVPALREMFKAQPRQVEFGEFAGKDRADPAATASVDFAAPEGAVLDSGRTALHARALAYQQQHGVSYLAAVQAVERSA